MSKRKNREPDFKTDVVQPILLNLTSLNQPEMDEEKKQETEELIEEFFEGFEEEYKAYHKYKKTVKLGIGSIIVLLIVIIMLLLFRCGCCCNNVCTPPDSDGRPVFDLTEDPNAQEGERETTPKEEIQEALNKQVEAGMMNISMNSNPIFANGTSTGNLLIYNDPINKHPQVVEIYRDDNNELVYRSGTIPVGSRIDTGTLMVDLPAGEYECTAFFNGIDENTGELVGKAGAEIVISVQN